MNHTCSIDGCGRSSRRRGWCNKHYGRWRRHGDPLAGGTIQGAPMQWLRDHLDYTGDECLIWPFSRTCGYGNLYIDGKSALISRLMCEHRHGPPPTPKHEAAHSCGRGPLGCVNGSHLRWATPKENNADKLIHGTHNRGDRNGTAKLTDADVLAIRSITGISQEEIARRYGISQVHVSRIKSRDIWAWL